MPEASTDIPNLIADAVRHHQAGQLDAAERLYRHILAVNPHHADSLHLLGLIAHQKGRHDAAAALLRQAIGINPEAVYYSNLGLVLKAQADLDGAAASYRQAVILDPDSATTHNNLGTLLWEQGKLEDAEGSYRRALVLQPDDAEIRSNLGTALYQQGRLEEAMAQYRRAILLEPDNANTHKSLGTALYELGRLDEAVASYRQALALNPGDFQTHASLGNALKGQGELDQAEASYRRALASRPDFAEAHNNLGTVLWERGKTDAAIACYRQALILKPDIAGARSNLGNALYWQGRFDDAATVYRRVLETKPQDTDALDSLATVKAAQGELTAALKIISGSLQIRETDKNKRIFANIVRQQRFTKDDREIRALITRALTDAWARPLELARSATDFVKLDPEVGGCVAQGAGAWPARLSASSLFGPSGLAALANDRLLGALLTATQNTDIAMERFLTMARRLLLDAAMDAAPGDAAAGAGLDFYAVLARQCFINDYVFFHADEEIRQAQGLRDALSEALAAQTPISELWLLAVAAYFPLRALSGAPRLMDRSWADSIIAVLVQQLQEPEKEAQLRGAIPRLTAIENTISRLVRDQYEENPYPRWVKTPSEQPVAIATYLRRQFPFAPFGRESGSEYSDVLVAGCGTGQHSIEVTQRIKGQVLAIDLSLSSLAYAERKTRELGLPSITHAQADLLELASPGRRFDVIECAGVLHHMPDIFAGWRILLSLLRPGGFMMLGLYSKLARRSVVRARRFIAEREYGATADAIRRCRQDLMGLDHDHDFRVVQAADFFGIGSCRDLLFHTQEQQTTLTDIGAFLGDHDLTLLGFEIEDAVQQAYRQRFPDDPAATNLNNWQAFEISNPDTFFDMYSFWVQKKR